MCPRITFEERGERGEKLVVRFRGVGSELVVEPVVSVDRHELWGDDSAIVSMPMYMFINYAYQVIRADGTDMTLKGAWTLCDGGYYHA